MVSAADPHLGRHLTLIEPEIKPTGTNVVPNRADFLGVGWIQRSPPCQSGMAERQHNGVVASQFVTVNTAAPNRIPTSVWTDPRSNRPWVVRVWLSTGTRLVVLRHGRASERCMLLVPAALPGEGRACRVGTWWVPTQMCPTLRPSDTSATSYRPITSKTPAAGLEPAAR